MTREQIKKGMPLLLAAKTEFEAMAEAARCAIHYCYDQEAKKPDALPERIRRFPADAPYLDSGCAGCSGDVLRGCGPGPGYGAGTVMAIYLLTTVFPAKTFQIPVYVETQVLLEDLMSGGLV